MITGGTCDALNKETADEGSRQQEEGLEGSAGMLEQKISTDAGEMKMHESRSGRIPPGLLRSGCRCQCRGLAISSANDIRSANLCADPVFRERMHHLLFDFASADSWVFAGFTSSRGLSIICIGLMATRRTAAACLGLTNFKGRFHLRRERSLRSVLALSGVHHMAGLQLLPWSFLLT